MNKKTKTNPKGAGRPFSHPTKIITFRIRPEWEPTIRAVVNKEIEKLKGGN